MKALWGKLFRKDKPHEPVDIIDGYRTGLNDTGAPYIHCLRCSMTSYSLDDIENRYCGFCRKYHARVVYDYQ